MSNAMMNLLEQYEIQEVEQQEREGFKIESLDQVNWAFRKIKAFNTKKAEIEALAKAEIDRINNWKEKELSGITGSIEFFEGLLTAYAITQKKMDPKFKCSTPYGKIGFRKQQPKWEYDEEELIKSLKAAGMSDFIRTKEEPKKNEIKDAVTVVNGKAINSNGEILEGITVVEQGEAISIKVVE